MRQTFALAAATLAVAILVSAPASAQNLPTGSNLVRTTLNNPYPQYTWNGGGPPPAGTSLTRGVTTTVTGSVVWDANRTPTVPTYAQAVVRTNTGYYWRSGYYYLNNYRVVSPSSFSHDQYNGADFSIPFNIGTGYPSGTSNFFVEYYNANGSYVGAYNATFSGGTEATATPTSPSLFNWLTIFVY